MNRTASESQAGKARIQYLLGRKSSIPYSSIMLYLLCLKYSLSINGVNLGHEYPGNKGGKS